MQYTIRSARYGNEEQTAAVIDTVESGAVAVSIADRPALWHHMMTCGVEIAPYEPIDPRTRDAHPEDMGKPVDIT